MSHDDDYYAFDAAQSEYDSKIATEAIKEFKYELLQNYLIKTADLIARPRSTLDEAVLVLPYSPTAAYLLASISAEVCVKKLLLQPVVHGLINQEYAASLVADLVLGHRAFDRLNELLIRTLAEEGGIDLNSFRRTGVRNSILEEIKSILRTRNNIAHRADMVSTREAEHALAVAYALLNQVFPLLLDRFYLCLHNGSVIYKSYLEIPEEHWPRP